MWLALSSWPTQQSYVGKRGRLLELYTPVDTLKVAEMSLKELLVPLPSILLSLSQLYFSILQHPSLPFLLP